MPRHAALILALSATLAGCSGGWKHVDGLGRVFPARTQVQVWQGGESTLLHGVSVELGILRGVPFTQHPGCDSCRVQVALAEVDSLRVGSKERGFFRTLGLLFLLSMTSAYLSQGIDD